MAVRASRIYALAVKTEVTEGTDVVPSLATDAVRMIGFPMPRIGYLEEGKRGDVVHAGLGSLGRVEAGGRYIELDRKSVV